MTSEIIEAAQQVTNHRSDIRITPGPPDEIYVSVAATGQLDSLKRALDEIAKRHGLAVSRETANVGYSFAFGWNGQDTQIVHVGTTLPVPAAGANSHVVNSSGNAQLAIILDDLGNDRSAADAALSLPFALTVSVLPQQRFSKEVAEEAYRHGDQVMLHLPMQAEKATPERGELKTGMSSRQVKSALAAMLKTVPHTRGVNNHEGSRATADPKLMSALMLALRQRRLFFIDSRTTAATVAYEEAEKSGVPAASRKVFLDDTVSSEAIRAQLDIAAQDALRDGSSIAIAHPHPETIATLARNVPLLRSRGIQLVFASQLVH